MWYVLLWNVLALGPYHVATRLLWPWNSPGKNTRVGSHSLLQGIIPTQGSNLGPGPTVWGTLHLVLEAEGEPHKVLLLRSRHSGTFHDSENVLCPVRSPSVTRGCSHLRRDSWHRGTESVISVPFNFNGSCRLNGGCPGGFDGKESACSGGDLGSIHELGRSPGEGNS